MFRCHHWRRILVHVFFASLSIGLILAFMILPEQLSPAPRAETQSENFVFLSDQPDSTTYPTLPEHPSWHFHLRFPFVADHSKRRDAESFHAFTWIMAILEGWAGHKSGPSK